MGVYRSREWWERDDRRYDWTSIGLVVVVLAALFAVPVILLWAVLS